MTRFGPAALLVATLSAGGMTLGQSATHENAKEPGRPNRWGYDYSAKYDAEIAAGDVHRVRYKDSHIWLMEVSNPPGFTMEVHGHPYPSVFARDSDGPAAGAGLSVASRYLDPDSPKNGQGWRGASGPDGHKYPQCTSADPQAPHNPANAGDWPLHFFRIEFIRVDQDDTNAMRHRYGGQASEKTLYETPEMRLVEETIPASKTLPAHIEAYPSVLAFDAVPSFDALVKVSGPGAGKSDPPVGYIAPLCMTTEAGKVAALTNKGELPIHFYRVDFKRVGKDGQGEDLKHHWKEWYPFMLQMKGVK